MDELLASLRPLSEVLENFAADIYLNDMGMSTWQRLSEDYEQWVSLELNGHGGLRVHEHGHEKVNWLKEGF